MSRKVLLANLTKRDEPTAEAPPPVANRMRARPILGSPELITDTAAGPIGAIGQSLGEVSERARRAEEVERKLTEGQVIIEIDTALIDPSFVSDRMPVSKEALTSLTEKIRDHGQLNPILVRPHPEAEGRYQVAFGHRRLRAVMALGLPVRAVVRKLTDEQLVIAQGQENHEREDLSYVEKALFARRLEQRGFSRTTIMAAMSIYKSDLSNMLSVATRIPEEVINAIGPAPGIGRRAWLELVALMAEDGTATAVRSTIADPAFAALESEIRFKQVIAATKTQATRGKAESWLTSSGETLAKVTQDEDRVSLTIDRRKSPEFAEFVLTRLRDLYAEFKAGP
ncbi:plasmid partitioning protein RepB [Methylobacterium isbiliense]|uniref:Nucleoid occlusion protein n=1 Tax=Methylobacterium isbiliense TaxID=315478 RepID=A0ABQ4SSC4_9HYPH|nr:plasmid partitioning protein RepB [Methylobacterium isbiliense]MDN3627699.1 plasmid partitioning protein RepB [Methylobacterium isbiliense]GJE04689.1 Nucleoid occlusion protein [Methylobacterium isbiliense]